MHLPVSSHRLTTNFPFPNLPYLSHQPGHAVPAIILHAAQMGASAPL